MTTPRSYALLIPIIAGSLAACGGETRRTRIPEPDPTRLSIEAPLIEPVTLGVADQITLTAQGGSEMGYVWRLSGGDLVPGWSLGATDGPMTTVGGTATATGTFSFTVGLTDSDNNDAERVITVEVVSVFAISTPALDDAIIGEAYTGRVAAVNGQAPFLWALSAGELPPGLMLVADGSEVLQITGTPTMTGDFSFTIQATDGGGQAAERAYQLSVGEPPPQLNITTATLPDGQNGVAYTATITTDGMGSGFTWTVLQGSLPPGLSLSGSTGPTATIEGTPTSQGSFPFALQVSNADATGAASFNITIGPGPDDVLQIATSMLPPSQVNVPYDAMIVGAGGTGFAYRWRVFAGVLPPGLQLETVGTPATRLRGTPNTPGTYNFTLEVEDSQSDTALRAFTMEVSDSLQFVTNNLPSVFVGESYEGVLTAAGGTAPYQWSVSQGSLPAGLTLRNATTSTTVIEGVPTTAGMVTFTIRVEDTFGGVEERALTIEVRTPPPLTISTMTLPGGRPGQMYDAPITAAGGTGRRYTWTSTGALPPGVTLTAMGTPTTRLFGLPSQGGIYNVTITVEDSARNRTSQNYSFEISATALMVTTAVLPDANEQAPYMQTISADGGSGIGYQWSVVQGTLPPGIALDVTGTPSTNLGGVATSTGTFDFTIQVEDSAGTTATRAYTLIVQEVLPTVNLPTNLNDSGPFLWDVQRTGAISNGTSDAFDTGVRLSINGAAFPSQTTAAGEAGGRELVLGPATVSGMTVRRKIFVPTTSAFARFLEVVENPSTQPAMVTVAIATNLGSDSSTRIITTSSGDTTFNTMDDWITTDDTGDNSGDPNVTHIISGAGARIEPTAATRSGDNVNYSYAVMIPPGERALLLHFVMQRRLRTDAATDVVPLHALQGDALVSLSASEQRNIVNFAAFPDTDQDGLSDMREMMLGTNPNLPDTDMDGLLDGYEVDFGFDPLTPGDGAMDADMDQATNLQEQTAGTDPRNPDTDMDGLLDGLELNTHNTDPFLPDTDMDGLNDGPEVLTHMTDPTVADTDMGGRTDSEEVLVDGTDPLDGTDDVVRVSLPMNLTDGQSFLWDILGTGSISNGTSDAYDGGLILSVNGGAFPSQTMATVEAGGRELALGPATVSGLTVVRKIYVSDTNGFARFLEIVSNPGATPVAATITLNSNLGSDSSTQLVATSSGDLTFDTNDDWIITDDSSGTGDPSVSHQFSGENAMAAPSSVFTNAPGNDDVRFEFMTMVPAGGRVIVMHFATQRRSRTDSTTAVNTIATFARDELMDMTAMEQSDVINFLAFPDSDGDGLSDPEEAMLGTNPMLADTDMDGLNDGYEVRFGLNPTVAGDQLLDGDNDGLDNLGGHGSNPA